MHQTEPNANSCSYVYIYMCVCVCVNTHTHGISCNTVIFPCKFLIAPSALPCSRACKAAPTVTTSAVTSEANARSHWAPFARALVLEFQRILAAAESHTWHFWFWQKTRIPYLNPYVFQHLRRSVNIPLQKQKLMKLYIQDSCWAPALATANPTTILMPPSNVRSVHTPKRLQCREPAADSVSVS